MQTVPGVPPKRQENVVCPFCGLLCDDLVLEEAGEGIRVARNGCDRARAGFERPLRGARPRVDGRGASLEDAVRAAAAILRRARQPLVGGLATDVAGMRALVSLAERAGGILEHLHGDAIQRNLDVVQSRGWFTTTLTEIRNRADLIVLAGTDTRLDHPRFLERCARGGESLFRSPAKPPAVVHLGRPGRGTAPDSTVERINCDPDRLYQVFGAIRALLAGRPVRTRRVAGAPLRALRDLAERLAAATYGVVAWAPARMPGPLADLSIETICGLVADLNTRTRCAGFPLGGDDGGATATSVVTWLTGFPLRVAFAGGQPVHDPAAFAGDVTLSSGRADALLWVSSFDPRHRPPETSVPSVVLAPPGTRLPRATRVYIPVATPGVDHPGHLVRCDSAVTLPLTAVRASTLPRVSRVAAAIEHALAGGDR